MKYRSIITLVALSAVSVLATADNRYITTFYDVQSISKQFSNAQCRKLFSKTLHYTIKNDKVTYHDSHALLKHMNYKRLNVTFLSKNKRLFVGKDTLQLRNSASNSHPIHEYLSFVLDLKRFMIQGSYYIPHMCKGNIIGVKEQLNTWNNNQE